MFQARRIHSVYPHPSLHLGGPLAVAHGAVPARLVPRRRRAERVRLDIKVQLFGLATGPARGTGIVGFLDPSTAGKAAMPLTVGEPVSGGPDKGKEPQNGVGEIDPDCVLHALDPTVALGVLVDVHLAEDSKQRNPQNEKDQIPCPHEPKAQDEWHQIQQGCNGRQGADHFGVDPFAVNVCALLSRAAQVDSVQSAHGDTECELDDMNGGEDEVGETC